MTDFASLGDAGRRLGPVLRDALASVPDPLLLALMPNGVPVALGIRQELAIAVRPLPAGRSDGGVVIDPDPSLAGRHVVVVDDGVETGTAARAAIGALRASQVASATLAVPVCSREALADLELQYDRVVALVKPLARRSLAWHYADFDTVDEETARRLLGDLPSGGA